MITMIILQQTIDIVNINEGPAILIVGVLALLLAATVNFRNPAAGIAWAVSVLLLVLSGLLDLGIETFWLGIVATVSILAAGLVVRWSY